MGRAPCCDKANVKRGPWSPEEDDKLKSYIDKHGTGSNWIALPQKIGLKRCGKSCRLRWLNYLRPNIKHGGFTEDEDNLICNLYITIGSRWSIIAGQLPGRTDNDIKNYWNTRLKKKLLGKQKREQQNRGYKQQLETTTKNFHQNYYSLNNNNESLSTYTTWPLNQVSPPLSLTDSLIMSPFVTKLTYLDQTRPKDENFKSFEYIPDHTVVNQEVFKNLNFDAINGGVEASDINFQGLVNEEIVYYSMPQPCVDGVDLVNNSSTTTTSTSTSTSTSSVVISPESVILGDQMNNFLVYPYGYEAFQPIMGQDWNYLDVTGLPGY